MTIKLTIKEREAIEWLYEFSKNLLDGKTVEYQKPVVEHLSKMGIDLKFTIHKKVETLIRGKEDPYSWVITNAPWYIRGNTSKQYLPFQIKKLKEQKD